MLPHPTCPYCIEGAALQAAGVLPPGVPFCLEHEVPDVDGEVGEVSGRPGVLGRLVLRWQLRIGDQLFGWVAPFVAAVMAVAAGARLVFAYPRTSAALFALAGGWWAVRIHPGPTLFALSTALQVFAACALVAPTRCRLRALGWWRSLVVYRRLWRTAMHAAGLERRGADGEVQRPRYRRVRCLESVDVVHVRGLVGQRFGEWEEAAGMVAHVFGAHGVRVHRGDDRRLTVELVRGARGRSWNRDGVLDLEAAR
jgi:hypothetical protein